MPRMFERDSAGRAALRTLRPAGDGASGVKVGYWLLAIGCWLSAAAAQGAAQNKPRESTVPAPKEQACGPISDGVLKCPRFGFNYKIPFGWVDRTEDMQGGSEPSSESTTKSEADKSASPSKSQ